MDISPRLQLKLPTQVDPFSTEDVRDNWEQIDESPGNYICTSGTRPAWGTPQNGRKIYETNTGLEWVWDGTTFKRTAAQGLLKRTDGSFAIGERVTDMTTNTLAYLVVVSVTNVVIPAGNRPIQILSSYWSTSNADATGALLSVFRSSVSASGPQLSLFRLSTGGGSVVALERNGLAAGTYSFSIQTRAQAAGTYTIFGNSTQPIAISIHEL